jgi:hypothetical protein
MRAFFFLFFFFCLSEGNAQQDAYIDHPDSKDTLCIKELTRAKKDIAAGKLRYCGGYVWDYPYSRMFPELDSLCKIYEIIFTPDTGIERDVRFVDDPNTYYCYANFMNREIAKRFGSDFMQGLVKQADSIFISKSFVDTVPGYLCDVQPSSFDGWSDEFFKQFRFPDTCPLKTNCQSCEITIWFVVDIIGRASNLEFFYSKGFPLNDACKNLYQEEILRACNRVCDNKCWVPGMAANRKVISTTDFLIDLINHKIR